MSYCIVRHYYRHGKRVIRRGLTLAQARAHCSNPETSSRTAKGAAAGRVTRRHGPWFDAYTEAK